MSNGDNMGDGPWDWERLPPSWGLTRAEHMMPAPGARLKQQMYDQDPYPLAEVPDPRTVADELRQYSLKVSPFWYLPPTNPLTLASGATSAVQTITMAGDSYFICDRIMVRSTATAVNPMNTTIDFADNETAGRINNLPLPLDLLAGWSPPGTQMSYPRLLPRLKIWRPGTQIQYTLVDRGTGIVQVLDLVFAGYKMYVPTGR